LLTCYIGFSPIGPSEGIIKIAREWSQIILPKFQRYIKRVAAFPCGPGGLGRSEGLVGTISTYPGTCQHPW